MLSIGEQHKKGKILHEVKGGKAESPFTCCNSKHTLLPQPVSGQQETTFVVGQGLLVAKRMEVWPADKETWKNICAHP